MTRLDIHPDIAQAHTPPAWLYADPGIFRLQRERVFLRSWQFVGDSDVVRTPQHAHPFILLEGCLDEPLVLTRDDADAVHCLSNVCTHRANLVVSEPGRCAHLRCPYHGRRFDLDGTFRSMPEFDQVRGFPSEADNLPKVPFGALGKFLFASLSPSVELDAVLAPIRSRVGHMPLDAVSFEPTRSRDYLVRANWALYIDNYLEGFHIPFVHASLNAALDYGDYRTELFEHCNLQIGVIKTGEDTFRLPRSHPDHGQDIAAYYFWLFPNTMLNVYPWGVSVNVVRPLAVDLTKVSFLTYVWDPSLLDRGAGSQLDRVEREDESVVESVQRGLRSRLYTRGRYSPTREQGPHHFHRLLSSAMGEI